MPWHNIPGTHKDYGSVILSGGPIIHRQCRPTWILHDEMAGGVIAASHFVGEAARGKGQNKRPACPLSAIFAAQPRAREEPRHRSEHSV